jgi:hypothetical protein
VSPGRGARSPLSPPTTGQKSWHLIQPPTTTYRHGRSLGRRGNNTSVSPHCFTAHPVMGGEKRHCAHRTSPYASLLTLEGGYDKARTPRFQGFELIRSASTRPRLSLDPASTPNTTQQGEKDGMARHSGSFRRLVRYNSMASRDGLPFLGHVATVTSTVVDKTSPQGIRSPGLLSSYKRVGQGSGENNGTTDHNPSTR